MQEAMLSRTCGVSLGSDCCRSPCAGMHYSQLIISSCCHHQSLTANNSSLQLSPSVIFLFLKRKRRRKRKVFGMAEEKNLPRQFQQYKRQGNQPSIQAASVSGQESSRISVMFSTEGFRMLFPWIHSRTWLKVSQETVRQSNSDT